MMDLQPIQDAARQGQLFFTDHVLRQMIKRAITEAETVEAILNGEIIEEYPKDKYGPSCLLSGQTQARRSLHVLCSLPPRIRVITVYQPDPAEWIDDRLRRP